MRKYNIIIVENEEDEQIFMKEGFDATGLFTILAQVKNGDTLFEWMEAHPGTLPDIILSDLNMPGKNGYDIIDTIRATPSYSHIPVIITSTSSTPSIIKKCLDRGASDYIVKPDTFINYQPYGNELHARIEERKLVR